MDPLRVIPVAAALWAVVACADPPVDPTGVAGEDGARFALTALDGMAPPSLLDSANGQRIYLHASELLLRPDSTGNLVNEFSVASLQDSLAYRVTESLVYQVEGDVIAVCSRTSRWCATGAGGSYAPPVVTLPRVSAGGAPRAFRFEAAPSPSTLGHRARTRSPSTSWRASHATPR